MVYYESTVRKAIAKGTLPQAVVKTIHNAFLSIDATRDFALFDIKEMRGDYRRTYYRLRKGKYRAMFYVEDDIYVVYIGKRDEVYRLWE
ncbi:MAG: type II toxin-antitoxin system RelE family toxin [Spirochaetota bacterium]